MSAVWTPQALAAALGVLAVAVCSVAVLVARTYASVVNIVEGLHRSGIPLRGASPAHSTPPPAAMSAGAGRTGVPALLANNAVDQLAGVTVSSGPASTGSVDCGPACVVSEIETIKGTWSADELLRLRYFGLVDSRLTTAEDVRGMLVANHIAAHVRYVDAATARLEIVRNWEAGRASIVLGQWIAPGVGHWMRFRGGSSAAYFMDPWPDGPRVLSWDSFAALYGGVYVHVDLAEPLLPLG